MKYVSVADLQKLANEYHKAAQDGEKKGDIRPSVINHMEFMANCLNVAADVVKNDRTIGREIQ